MKKSEALKILGLSDGASDDAIKKAHREKVIENHPDKFAQDPTKKAAAEEKTKLINEARDVLLSRKWEPEFGNPFGYGSPGGYPRGSSQGGGSPYGDPFSGWPFGGGQGQGSPGWVWTSWDSVNQGRGSSTQSSPFDPFNPFGQASTPAKTPSQKRDEALGDLKQDLGFIGVKFAFALLLCIAQMWSGALLSYVLLTVIYALYKRYGSCLLVLVVPMVMMGIPVVTMLARLPVVAIILIPFFIAALIYDGRSVFSLNKAYRKAKKEAAKVSR